jgi:hypothetical protein
MPSLDKSFLNSLHCNLSEYPVFIETGTNEGNTIFAMEPYFKTLYTIELSSEYYTKTKSKYHGNKIQFIFGDSALQLQYIFERLDENSILFLDGHWSGGNTAKGPKDCPLIEEITLIAKYCKKECIIIIDDYRLFSIGPQHGYDQDWSDINKETLLQILGTRVKDVYNLDSVCAKDDRLIIHISHQ